jgi:hypothetical protein
MLSALEPRRFSAGFFGKVFRGIGILPMYSNLTGWKPVPQVAPGLHESAAFGAKHTRAASLVLRRAKLARLPDIEVDLSRERIQAVEFSFRS